MIALKFITDHTGSVELRQLVYFEAVVRHGGFTRAAEKLHVAQPAISAQVRRLEAELDVTLLARTTRRVALTHAGELLLVRARRALSEIEHARADLAGLATAVRGKVVVGATAVLGRFDLAGALARFTAAHPQVEVSLRSGLLEPMLDELGGRLDLVLGPLPAPLRAGLEATPLADERFVVITPPGHPLATRARLSWADLDQEVFVSLPPETGLRARLTGCADAAGTTVQVRFEAETPQGVHQLVAAGLAQDPAQQAAEVADVLTQAAVDRAADVVAAAVVSSCGLDVGHRTILDDPGAS